VNQIFKPFFNNNINKLDYVKDNTIGKHKNLYFDYTASGLGFKEIENRLLQVLETYANTHSEEASMAIKTKNIYDNGYKSLQSSLELDDSFVILASAYGATAAIKKFQELLGLYIPPATKKRLSINEDKKNLPLVIVGPYEHHSNEVSYREALCEVVRIGLNDDGLIDLIQLENILKQNINREIIGTFSVASNVTGIIVCYKELSKLLRAYNAVVCFDAAASSSYMNIDCSYYDAMVTSSHKLLGGPGACGLLIIKKDLIDSSLSPTFAGGGTVCYVNETSQTYSEDLVERETAGTPGIIQFIKAALAYKLRDEIGMDFIKEQKNKNLEYFLNLLKQIPNSIIYGANGSKTVGIVSFNIGDLNPYLICANMSENFGIQTRAGCSCAGPYGHDLLGFNNASDIGDKPGWVRVSIHFSHTFKEIDILIKSILHAIKDCSK
jgi:selenocysteine lyase/cysteine desulfurase